MPGILDLLKGAGRALTADVVGGPADLATDATNLLIGGGGYLGHKIGLIPTEKLPDLLEKSSVPLTSDWFAKNTPLEDTGSEAYSRGRLGAGFAAALGGALPKGVASTPKGQLNAILVPDYFAAKNNLSPASNAKISVPTGETYIPIDAQQDLEALKHVLSGPGNKITLADLYPKLSKLPESQRTTVESHDFPDPRVRGSYNPLTETIKLNSKSSLQDASNTAAHEPNHVFQNAALSLSGGGSPDNFSSGNYKLTSGFAQQFFPGTNLQLEAIHAASNPLDAYRGLTGEALARMGGKIQELHYQGGSQDIPQHLLDAVMRLEANNWRDAGITPRLTNPATGYSDQVYLPAHLGKQLINRDGVLYNQAGDKIGFSQGF